MAWTTPTDEILGSNYLKILVFSMPLWTFSQPLDCLHLILCNGIWMRHYIRKAGHRAEYFEGALMREQLRWLVGSSNTTAGKVEFFAGIDHTGKVDNNDAS